MSYLDTAREQFSKDVFATECTGVVIDEASPGYARCSLDIDRRHINAVGKVMGGAIFTIADFAFAVATNTGVDNTVSQTSQITYLSRVKGKKLIAETKQIKSGHTTCFYIVEVKDELGTEIAIVSITGIRVNH